MLHYLVLKIDDSEIRNSALTEEPEVKRVIVCGEVGFPCLRKFVYDNRYAWMNLTFAAGAMPNVDDLLIAFDPEETESVGTSGDFDLGIENLRSLLRIRCGPRRHDSSRTEAAIREAANKHSNHPSLSFDW